MLKKLLKKSVLQQLKLFQFLASIISNAEKMSGASINGVCIGGTLLLTASGEFKPSHIFSIFKWDLDALKLM